MLEELSVVPLCEGVETAQALNVLRDLDVSLIQG
jgi:EAL domain-containing protein (putative c-di-GMP-specific phosphodiesterase class I)